MKAPPHPAAPLADLLASTRPAAVWLRRLLLLALVSAGVSASATVIRYLTPPWIYEKDFLQEYLFARAVLGQISPYGVLQELGARFLTRPDIPLFPHPTPHPPPVVFVALPFGLLPYEQAQVAWLLLGVSCLVIALRLLLHPHFPGLSLSKFALICLITVPLLHFWEELGLGQMMMLQLLLLVAAWRALRVHRAGPGAILLGLALALKLIAWPIVILLMVGKKWRAIIVALATFACANLAAALILGPREVIYYYSVVSGWVWGIYRGDWGNFSLMSVSWRLFGGTGVSSLTGLHAPPLVAAPSLAYPAAILLVGIWLAVGLTWAAQARSFDVAFGMALCTSVLASPLTWCHYLILLVMPLSTVTRQVINLGFPRRYVYQLLLLTGLLSIPASLFHDTVLLFAQPPPTPAGSPIIPFTASLIDLIPAAAVIALLCLLRQLDRQENRAPASVERAGQTAGGG
jgi:hypothetical protein